MKQAVDATGRWRRSSLYESCDSLACACLAKGQEVIVDTFTAFGMEKG